MENIATNTYDFARIRTTGLAYVDKTAYIHTLANGLMGNQFFLSRPRRFGKSLLCSTLQCLFEGRRELFEGLAINSLPWDWTKTYPVIRLDMAACSGETLDATEALVISTMRAEAKRLGIALHESEPLPAQFRFLIEDVAATSPDGQCVLLIDEYDKPLTRWIGSNEVLPYQAFLKTLYSMVKLTESHQRFCLMTGVSKFSKVSIFSDLNNLTDITMDTRFAALLGYTHDEVRANFPDRLSALAQALDTDIDGAFARLEAMYDGYCFDRSLTRVFNPVSLGRCLDSADMRSYWFETGTPGWLMSYAKKAPIEVDSLDVPEASLGTYEPASPSIPAVLLQTGYLTIKDFEELGRSRIYHLGFPNHEVEDGFNEWLTGTYTDADEAETSAWALACRRAVATGDAEGFVNSLISFFSSIGYDLADRLTEQAYQCVAVAILRFIGMYASAEVTTSTGRIDMVMHAPGHVFVIEVKVASGEAANKNAARRALIQIRERGYAEPWRAGTDEVTLLGMTFDCLTHNVGAWAAERL